MTDTDYFGTFTGLCPNCNAVTPGHVRGDDAAGVYGWTCPECDMTHDPTEVQPAVPDAQRLALETALAAFTRSANSRVESYSSGDHPTDDVRVTARPEGGDAPHDLAAVARGTGFRVEQAAPDAWRLEPTTESPR